MVISLLEEVIFMGKFLKIILETVRLKESEKEIVLKRLHNLARKEL